MPEKQRPSEPKKTSQHVNRLLWLLIGVGFVLTGAFFIYVTRQ